jgi:O-antigen ligase
MSTKALTGLGRVNGRIVGVAGILGLAGTVAVWVATSLLRNGDLLMFAIVSVSIVLVIVLATVGVAHHAEVVVWRTGLILWTYLLASQQFFLRQFTSAEAALTSGYDSAAYGEAGTWLVVALVMFVLAMRYPEPFRQIWSGNFRFILVFVMLCCISSLYSPLRMLALAWSFKLVLVVLALKMCSIGMNDDAGVRSFLLATFCGFALLTLLPVVNGVVTGVEPFLPDGRLNYFDHPVHGSQWAGLSLLLALIVFANRAKIAIAWVGIAGAIMLASGGKAGIMAALVGTVLLLGIKRKPGQALLMLVGLSVVGVTVLTFTPLSQYLEDYSDSGAAVTLTGRTDLWAASLPMILEKPIIGHGYMSSRLIEESDRLEGFNWGPTQMHNSFLEIAYTGGAVGLVLLLTFHGLFIRNIGVAIKQRRTFAAGALVLYADLLLQSWVEGSVAGKASDNFMLLLGLMVVSERIVSMNQSAPGQLGWHPRNAS